MSQTGKKYFPIRTATACQLKWNWSTISLNSGTTRSCHRTAESTLTVDNFAEFHNTPIKIADRQKMLNGQWPDENCSYCREIEELGGFSDRQRQMSVPDMYPEILDLDPTATNISPTVLEIYFSNTCNLGCLYCVPELSSTIETENRQFGDFNRYGVKLISIESQFKNLVPAFWDWFPKKFNTIKRLHVLGGEPFYQQEFDKLLKMFDSNPNPQCELNIVTNLMVSKKRIENYLIQFKKLLVERKLKRIDITCSIDCWGEPQKYVRWGIDVDQWEENFKLLIENKWLYLNINQTISALTIKTMPELLLKLQEWRTDRKIGHWFSGVNPGPSYLKGEIFGNEFIYDAIKILDLMPTVTDEDVEAYKYMKGIFEQIVSSEQNNDEIKKLIVFLNEKDRRRNTDWRDIFPWLIKYEDLCGIQE